MEQPGSQPPVVLVVDDEALLRLHAVDLLEQAGFDVIEAENAEAAIRVLEDRGDVRVLFTDIQMPGRLDGMELARQVHARWPHVVLLVTSGRLSPRDEDIPDEGAFLSKPYGPELLVKKVRGLIDRHGG